MERKRLVNFGEMLVMLVVFLGTVGTVSSNRLDIGVNLNRALSKALDIDKVNYTKFVPNDNYVMHVVFDPKGMAGLYNITTFFMDLVQPKGLFPDDMELPLDDKGQVNVNKLVDKLPSLVQQYAGLLALTIIGLIFIILMPLVGFIFCCCRCCGNCGARSQHTDKKHDTCKKVVLAMFLIAVATLILFGVVCAFVSNKYIQDGTEELPNELLLGIKDISTYINTTDYYIKTLLKTNFNDLDNSLKKILDSSADTISQELTNISNATSFTTLAAFVTGLNDTFDDLQYMKKTTNELRVNASQLSDGLRRVKKELLHSLNNCKDTPCGSVRDSISKMNTTMDFDKLPDVSQQITNLTNIIQSGSLIEQMSKGIDSFNKIQENINDKIKGSIPEVERSIKNAGDSLAGGYNNISSVLKKVDKMLGDNGREPINGQAKELLDEYSKYRYYVGIAESSILLLIILCMTFGLMCGICGKRPEGYDDDCCNKGAGSRFLMMGVAIMFLFSFILMLITLVYFLSGMIAQRVICDTLQNPKDNKLFATIDTMLNVNATVPTNISSMIEECHRNESVYKVLKLESKLNMSDISSYLEKYNITGQIKQFQDNINFDGHIEIFNDDTKKQIDDLVQSGIGDIKFDRFKEILDNDNITSINLNEMATRLLELKDKLELHPKPENHDMIMSLKQNAMYLQMYQKNLVDPMVNAAHTLKNVSEKLEEDMKMNQDEENFTAVVEAVMEEIKNAQDYININGTKVMKKLAEEFSLKFEERILSYIYYVANATIDDVGKCGPLSNVYNSTLVATCEKIFSPWNGFWFCVGWCLILFIPAIILSVKLATLYQKMQSYSGQDVIPHKKGKKKKKRGHAEYEARGEMRAAPPRERDAPGGSSHPETRYADMAPKHWDDYPNGGPPQYQSAPLATEYERPPPYYYPGPGLLVLCKQREKCIVVPPFKVRCVDTEPSNAM